MEGDLVRFQEQVWVVKQNERWQNSAIIVHDGHVENVRWSYLKKVRRTFEISGGSQTVVGARPPHLKSNGEVTMKRVLLLMALFVIPALAGAWEFPLNPDRVPSLGLGISSGDISGDRYEVDMPNTLMMRVNSGPETESFLRAKIDVRLPLSNMLTLTAHYDQYEKNWEYKRGGGIYEERANLNGYGYGFELRAYMTR